MSVKLILGKMFSFKRLCLLFLCLFILLGAGQSLALTLKVGENATITEMNYHDLWFENDPNNPEPWPDQREAYSDGNTARVSLEATPSPPPGHAGQANAFVGVEFDWDSEQYTWDEVKDWPIKVTVNFSYQIAADWFEGHGSANAGVDICGFSDLWYDHIGREFGEPGSHSKTVSETYQTTVEGLGDRIAFQVYCQAHSAYTEDENGNPIGTTHSSSSTVTIHSIKIEFGDFNIEKITNVKMYIGVTPLDITDPVFLNGVDLNVKFEPEIDWGDGTSGTIKYITPKNTYEETGSKTFNVGTEFGVGGKLKVVAVSSDGIESDPYEVPFEVAPVPVGESSWFSFDTGSLDTGSPKYSNLVSVVLNLIKEDVDGASIPADLPIFGGKSVNVEMFPSVNLEVGLNGEGKFLNLSIGKGKDSSISYAGKRVPLVEKKRGRRTHLAKQCQIDAEIAPGIGCSYDKTEKKWNYGGSLGLGLEGYCQLPPHYIVVFVGPVPIPLYARLGAGIDAYNSLTLSGLNFNSSGGLSFIDPTWDGMFTIYPYGKLMFGVGAADVAAVEGYGKGGLGASFHYPAEPHLEDVCIKLNAGVTVVILIFHHDFDLWHHDWCLNKSKAGLQGLELGTSGTELTPLSRDYLKKRPYAHFYKQSPIGLPKGAMPVMGAEENIVQENIYPYSQPVIVPRNGDTYIFWLYDDPERGSLNRTELVFSQWTEGGWSALKAVSDDGTADFHPRAGVLPDGRVLVVWENVKQELPDDATLDDMVSEMEISYAIYNPTSDSWQSGTLTNNAFLDRSPKLAIGEDGTALLVWVENKENDLFGGSNDLMYAFWDGNNWASNQTIATDLGPIIKASLAYEGTEGVLIWESDEDDDLSTVEDRELREAQFNKGTGWQDEGLFTQDNVSDLNPQVLYRNGEPYLIWLKDNDLVMVKDLDPFSQAVAVEDMKSPGGMSFKAINRPQGLALAWSDSSEKGADIYVAYWDNNYNKWGKPNQLTDDDSLERSIDGCYIDANTLKLIYDKVKINYTTEGLPQPERTDLYTLTYKEGTDVLLNDIYLSNSSPLLGEDIVITAEVANIGESVEEDIPVSFYKGNPQAGGELIGTASVDGLLAPEESKEVSINWPVDETPTVIYAVADPNQEITNDRNWANNTINIAIGTVPGDANGDTDINVQDVICIINVILDPTFNAEGNPDCNEDGSVNVQDVICVINKILGG